MPKMKNYGLHVANHIIKNVEFSTKISRSTNTNKKSNYNRKVKCKECQVCGYKPNKKNMMPLETHHISFQSTSDSNGFHNHVHKNKSSNLIVLCNECHTKVHNNQIFISGYNQTENGRKLEIQAEKKIDNINDAPLTKHIRSQNDRRKSNWG